MFSVEIVKPFGYDLSHLLKAERRPHVPIVEATHSSGHPRRCIPVGITLDRQTRYFLPTIGERVEGDSVSMCFDWPVSFYTLLTTLDQRNLFSPLIKQFDLEAVGQRVARVTLHCLGKPNDAQAELAERGLEMFLDFSARKIKPSPTPFEEIAF